MPLYNMNINQNLFINTSILFIYRSILFFVFILLSFIWLLCVFKSLITWWAWRGATSNSILTRWMTLLKWKGRSHLLSARTERERSPMTPTQACYPGIHILAVLREHTVNLDVLLILKPLLQQCKRKNPKRDLKNSFQKVYSRNEFLRLSTMHLTLFSIVIQSYKCFFCMLQCFGWWECSDGE